MDVYTAIKIRKSVRAYLNKPVEEDKLKRILGAARLAPSASNRQEWRLVIVRDKEMRKRMAEAANNQHFVGEAPVVIAACAEGVDHVMPCGQLCYPIDVAIIIDHLTLAAVQEGLGTCWIGAFDEVKVKKILGITQNIRVVELMPLGYPKEPQLPRGKSRLDLDKIIKWEKWN